MTNKLFVGGLSWDTKEDSLQNFFTKAGTVLSAKVITDKFTGRSKGFGFVEMGTPEEAEKAIKELNGQSLDGRAINVSEARPKPDGDRFAGGGDDKADDKKPVEEKPEADEAEEKEEKDEEEEAEKEEAPADKDEDEDKDKDDAKDKEEE